MAGKSDADVIITIKSVIDDSTKRLRQVSKTVKEVGKNGHIVTKQLDKVNGRWRQVSKSIQTNTTHQADAFKGWAMSIMFFGMALQRVFNMIWKSSTKTFQDVMHSVEGSVTSFDFLSGSMKYLGFVAGEALEPLAELLFPIIDAISGWIEKNPALFRTLVALSGILGTMFFVGGTVVLAAAGFKELGAIIFGVNGKFGSFLATVQKKGLFTALKDSLSTLKKAFKNLSSSLSTSFMKNYKWLKANPIKSLVGVGAIAGIIMAVIWLNKMAKSMGGWGELGKSAIRGFLRLVIMLGETLIWLGNTIISGLIMQLNYLIRTINSLIMSDLVQWGANKLGIDTATIKEISPSQYDFGQGILEKYVGWEEKGWLAPEQGYATGFEGGLPAFEVIVELDGEKVSNSVSTRILEQVEAT